VQVPSEVQVQMCRCRGVGAEVLEQVQVQRCRCADVKKYRDA